MFLRKLAAVFICSVLAVSNAFCDIDFFPDFPELAFEMPPVIVDYMDNNRLDLIKKSLNAENINDTYENHNTALLYAMFKSNTIDPEIIIYILKTGARVNVKNDNGNTPMSLASIRAKDPRVIKALVKYGADPNERFPNQYTPLMEALENNFDFYPQIITALIESGANVNPEYDFFGRITSPLIIAVENLEIKAGGMLEKYGYDRNNHFSVLGDKKKTAAIPVINMLLKAGADVNFKNENGETPIMLMARKGEDPELVGIFINAGGDPDSKDKAGYTPLMRSIDENFNRPEIALALLSFKTDANAVFKNSSHKDNLYTPLMFAVRRTGTDFRIFLELVKAGADINAKNAEGETPLIIALKNNNFEAANFLVEIGADAGVRDNSGNTAYDYAKKSKAYTKKDLIKFK